MPRSFREMELKLDDRKVVRLSDRGYVLFYKGPLDGSQRTASSPLISLTVDELEQVTAAVKAAELKKRNR